LISPARFVVPGSQFHLGQGSRAAGSRSIAAPVRHNEDCHAPGALHCLYRRPHPIPPDRAQTASLRSSWATKIATVSDSSAGRAFAVWTDSRDATCCASVTPPGALGRDQTAPAHVREDGHLPRYGQLLIRWPGRVCVAQRSLHVGAYCVVRPSD